MKTDTVTESILDVAADPDRLAHLPCGIAAVQPDEPMHALCGHSLLGVDANPHAPHCEECSRRQVEGGPIAAWVGRLRCDSHQGARS